MIGVFAFWAALFFPGYALVRALDPEVVQGGPLATVARSYVATFVLLTPVSVLCYALRLPIVLFATGVVVAVLGSLLFLLQSTRWRPRLVRPSLVACIGTLVLAADMYLGSRFGTHMAGDTGFHVGRARMLIDHGFNNWDPIIGGHIFEPLYHTNIYHALLAACAVLTGVHPGVAWLSAWPWAKLLQAAGAYTLAFSVFRERWLGWIAATAVTVFMATYSTLSFPNTLAPYCWLPMALGFGIDAMVADRGRRDVLWLAAISLVLAQVHMLHALFFLIVVGTSLAAKLAWSLWRKRPGRRQAATALLAACACLPWLIVPTWPRIAASAHDAFAHLTQSAPPQPQPATPAPPPSNAASSAPPPTAAPSKPAAPPPSGPVLDRNFLELSGTWVMGDAERLSGLNSRYVHALALLLIGLISPRRKRLLILVGMVAVAGAALFFPPFCTALLHVAGAGWILWRLTLVFVIVGFAVTPAVIFWLAAPYARKQPYRTLLQTTGMGAAIAYGLWLGVDGGPWTRKHYLDGAKGNIIARRVEVVERTAAFFRKNVRPDETIAATLGDDYHVAMHCNCYVLAPTRGRGARGVTDMPARRDAIDQLLRASTTSEERLAILRRYNMRTVFVRSRPLALMFTRGLQPYVARVARAREATIIRLDLSREARATGAP